jgi:hypothetical protein
MSPTSAVIKEKALYVTPLECAIQSARFFNNEAYFEDKALALLLNIFERCNKEDREKFFRDLMSCRIRNCQLEDAQVSYIFKFDNSKDMRDLIYDVIDIQRLFRRIAKGSDKEQAKMFMTSLQAFNSLKQLGAEVGLSKSNYDDISIDEFFIGLQKLNFTIDYSRLKNLLLKSHDLLLNSINNQLNDDRLTLSIKAFCHLFPISERDNNDSGKFQSFAKEDIDIATYLNSREL